MKHKLLANVILHRNQQSAAKRFDPHPNFYLDLRCYRVKRIPGGAERDLVWRGLYLCFAIGGH